MNAARVTTAQELAFFRVLSRYGFSVPGEILQPHDHSETRMLAAWSFLIQQSRKPPLLWMIKGLALPPSMIAALASLGRPAAVDGEGFGWWMLYKDEQNRAC